MHRTMRSPDTQPSPSGACRLLVASCLICSMASGQDSNHFFCGTSWGDASNNCDERQHCPEGTDDSCTTDGHVCFGGTTCDVKLGHGNKFKYANVDYNDISNTRFCGASWNSAIDECSIATHCPSGFSEECPDGKACYGGLSCNVQDLVKEKEEKEEEDDAAPPRIDKHSPRRKNFCGTSWGDASEKCRQWCPNGEDTDCPGGQGCYGNTGCFYSEDLVPTETPIAEPTAGPSTLPPVEYSDASNTRYCGISWAMAQATCSLETHCPGGSDDECPKGQTCHGGMNALCNYYDLKAKAYQPTRMPSPTTTPSFSPFNSEDVRNFKFCGKSWTLANEGCSLQSWCPNDVGCPVGSVCYGGMDKARCNAALMTLEPTKKPTPSPTESPTYFPTAPTVSPSLSPTTETKAPVSLDPTISPKPTSPPMIPMDDPRHSYWCGKNWADVTKNCAAPCISGSDSECPDGLSCIAFTTCRPQTPKPTRKPVTRKPSKPPSTRPTMMPTVLNIFTLAPVTPRPVTPRPTFKPTYDWVEPVETPRPVGKTSPPTEKETFPNTKGEEEDWGGLLVESKPAEPIVVITAPPSTRPTSKQKAPPGPQTNRPTRPPTRNPTKSPVNPPTRPPAQLPTSPPAAKLPPVSMSIPPPEQSLVSKIGSILTLAEPGMTNDVLLSFDPSTNTLQQTKLYGYDGFLNAIGLVSKGDLGSDYMYLGDDSPWGQNYGLVNIALFLSQSVIETVQFDLCDEISWEKNVFGKYPISNSCGQGKFSGGPNAVPYQDKNQCSDDEAYMSCAVDPEMTAKAISHGIFPGAPPPLECYPSSTGASSTSSQKTGSWDSSLSCRDDGCNFYAGQVIGNIDQESVPSSNSFGRSDVSGCCWWGRGAFPRGSAGTCVIGRLNYFLGKRAHDEGRPARYPDLDLCKNPDAVCRGFYDDQRTNAEIRWLMGLVYWITRVQTYEVDGWSYMRRLRRFVDGGLSDALFLEDVSRIITRGCHAENACGRAVSSEERIRKFEDVILYFGKAQSGEEFTVTMAPEPARPPTKRPTTQSPISPAPVKAVVSTLRPSRVPPSMEPIMTVKPFSVAEVKTNPPVSFAPVAPVQTIPSSGDPVSQDFKLTSDELAYRLNYANFYCAASLEEAKAKCTSTLRTCNKHNGDPPCSTGLACWPNVICSISFEDVHFGSASSGDDADQAEEEKYKPDQQTLSPVPSQDNDSPSNERFMCSEKCLRLLTMTECTTNELNIAFGIPNCKDIFVGDMCETTEKGCESNLARNCNSNVNVFIRVSMEECANISPSPSIEVFETSDSPISPSRLEADQENQEAETQAVGGKEDVGDIYLLGDTDETNEQGDFKWWAREYAGTKGENQFAIIFEILKTFILSFIIL